MYLEAWINGSEVLKKPSLLISLLHANVTIKLSRVLCITSPRTITSPLQLTWVHNKSIQKRPDQESKKHDNKRSLLWSRCCFKSEYIWCTLCLWYTHLHLLGIGGEGGGHFLGACTHQVGQTEPHISNPVLLGQVHLVHIGRQSCAIVVIDLHEKL